MRSINKVYSQNKPQCMWYKLLYICSAIIKIIIPTTNRKFTQRIIVKN